MRNAPRRAAMKRSPAERRLRCSSRRTTLKKAREIFLHGSGISDKESGNCGKDEQKRDHDGRIEKEFLRAAALVERRCEIVASECSTESCAAPLKHDADHEEKGEDDFRIRQYRRKCLHL